MRIYMFDSLGHTSANIKSRAGRISTIKAYGHFHHTTIYSKYFLDNKGDVYPESCFARFMKRGKQVGVSIRMGLIKSGTKDLFIFSPGLSEELKAQVAENTFSDVYIDYAARGRYDLEKITKMM